MVKRYFLDTNAIISLLNGNEKILSFLEKAEWVGISVISQIEFLSFPKITDADFSLFLEFMKNVAVQDLSSQNNHLINEIIKIRKIYKLKMPDAIIATQSILANAHLVTSDKQLNKIKGLKLQSF